MPARTIDRRKARIALLTDARFNNPDAAVIGDRYLSRLIALSQKRVAQESDVTYLEILWLQIALGLEALANGYPHLAGSGHQENIAASLKCAVVKQQRELGRLSRVSHENVELGNLASVLGLPLVKVLNENLAVPFKDFIETDPGCVLSVLVTYWLH